MSYPAADAVAWMRLSPSGNVVRLCQRDLDYWFDDADNETTNEPMDWGWGLLARPPSRTLTLSERFFVERGQLTAADRARAMLR